MKRRTLVQVLGANLVTAATTNRTLASTPDQKGQPMIIVTVDVEFDDGGIHQHLNAIQAMNEATEQEPGCIAYRSSFDAINPNLLRIYEMWESMEALEPHFKTPHMAAFQQALAGLNTKGMTAKVYEVSRELPFPNE